DDIHRRLLMDQYAPLSVVVDEHYEIIHVSKSGSRYLRFVEGAPTSNILQVVHPGLRIELRTALFTAFRKGKSAQAKRIQFAEGSEQQVVNLVVRPITAEPYGEGYVQVVFEEASPLRPTGEGATVEGVDASLVEQLEEELQRTTHRLQTTIEEYETSNEELKASNEELQSMNEELQSTTEELETGKEELQSMNEELVTVNQELKNKIEELNRTNSDLQNLMAATEIGTLFLDRDLRVKRFTPRLAEVFNILRTDVGRPFAHLTHTLDYPALVDDARQVLEDLSMLEREVTSKDNRWYMAQLRPYRTLDDRIDGVVLTFVDITEPKKAAEKDHFQAYILAHINDGVIAADTEGRVLYANEALGKMVGVDPQSVIGEHFTEFYNVEWLSPKDREQNYKQLEERGYNKSEILLKTHDGRSIHTEFTVTLMTDEQGNTTGRLAAIRDITERRRAEQQQRQAEARYRFLVENIQEYAILLLDSDGRITATNPGAEAVMGYSEEDLIEQHFSIIFTTEDRAAGLPEQELHEATAQGGSDNEGWRLCKDGSLFWANGVLTAIQDGDGPPTGFIKVVRDTTERKKAQELLNQQARQQAVVAELGLFALSTPDMQALMDRAVQRVADTLDVAYCKVLELQPKKKSLLLRAGVGWQEGLVGQATVGTGKDSQAGYTLRANEPVIVDDLREESRFSGPPLLTDHKVISGISVVIQSGDRPYGVMGAHTTEHRGFTQQDSYFLQAIANILGDAIRRQKAEKALRKSKDRFRAVAETVPDILFTTDADIHIEYLNQRWQAFTGLPIAHGIGDAWQALLHPEDQERVRNKWKTAQETSGRFEDRQRLRTADDTYHWILVRAQSIENAKGEIIRWYGTATDIDDLVQAEQEIKQLNETLEERVQKRTAQVRALASALTLAEQQERRRIAQILHDDLQQMLYGLDMAIQQLRRDDLSDVQKRFVQQSETILDQAIDTTRSLTVELSPPVLKGEGLTEAFDWLAVHVQKVHRLDVEVDSNPSVKIPSEDMRVLLFQLVRELLFNVTKHAEVDAARVTMHLRNDNIVITVEDEGIGFVPEAEKPAAKSHSSSGFGLFSIHERLDLFGGDLEIDSAPERGTRITITVPLAATESAPNESQEE
ncbi:MAG TPA: PAS domain S-box protein, partial [Rhodothermales bacterium]|nr:PAS domain S-box protein [Rhodothermales bacterium]